MRPGKYMYRQPSLPTSITGYLQTLITYVLYVQAVCDWGRDSVESWGRRKRSVSNVTEEEKEEDMTLSQEILVLDFGDEKQSEFLKSELSSADFGRGK